MLPSLILASVFIIFLGLIFMSFAYAGLRAAPWVPAWGRDIDRILRLADIKKGQVAYELGCGDGRILQAFERAGAKAIGFELAFAMYLWSKLRMFFGKNKNAKVRFRDFWNISFADADVVYFYLMPHIYPKLEAKLKKELRPGTKIIVYAFPFPEWKPVKIDKETDQPTIYFYIV